MKGAYDYEIERLQKMIRKNETSEDSRDDGAAICHWSVRTLFIDDDALRALLDYYQNRKRAEEGGAEE